MKINLRSIIEKKIHYIYNNKNYIIIIKIINLNKDNKIIKSTLNQFNKYKSNKQKYSNLHNNNHKKIMSKEEIFQTKLSKNLISIMKILYFMINLL